MKTKMMKCPQCLTEINLDEVLISQFEQSIKKDLEAELHNREAELNLKRSEFIELEKQLAKEKEDVDDLVNSRVKSQLSCREDALKETIRKEINEEKTLQLQELENELIKKSGQLQELNRTKAQLESLRREMEEAETRIVLQKERELTERLEQARSSIKEQVQQESFLKLKERENVINQLKEQLDIAKRKAEQGSMQGQGEILETYLEETLRTAFPTDEIIEIKKGELGADCIQKVKTSGGVEIGQILWEVKNTQAFSNGWIDKLKGDNLKSKCTAAVIVTKTMPRDITGKFGVRDGIWICSTDSVQELCLALRFGMLKIQEVLLTQHGKQSKQELLYAYLTSQEFSDLFSAILEGFKKIQDSFDDEKKKITHLWAARQKHLELILSNAVSYYGSIRAVTSGEAPEIKMLEFRQAV